MHLPLQYSGKTIVQVYEMRLLSLRVQRVQACSLDGRAELNGTSARVEVCCAQILKVPYPRDSSNNVDTVQA